MEMEKAKSLDITRLLAFWGLMSGNNPNLSCKRKTRCTATGFLFYPFP